ncbi:DUF2375 family protein [Thalassotalea fonticola]|uniref:DUF2375 family protein n=1 Tax=Thalassotalea fonticola TaxID=3065649 RepID=A0ABZ0GUA6_9GAMM|nr:DUF2375 family protein [Colwelliaceae bacterium S1-1]
MPNQSKKLVTVIYYDVNTLKLNQHVGEFPALEHGRVIIPQSFKVNKNIVAVCDGENIPLEIEYTQKNNRQKKMQPQDKKTVSVFYYNNRSLELKHQVLHYPYTNNGKVLIPNEFKKFRNILTVYDGNLKVLNKIGERILPLEKIA